MSAWRNFTEGKWSDTIDVRDFMSLNYKEYLGDSSFLKGPTQSSLELNNKFFEYLKEEKEKGGIIELDTKVVASITSHGPGYIDKNLEKIVGLQTDKPFKRAFHPYGGIRVAEQAANAYGYEIDEDIKEVFTKYRKTHNQGVYDMYDDSIRAARRSGIVTGLPDGYGRGRIIGDYRRVALYGVNYLIEEKKKDKETYGFPMTEDKMRLRGEIAEQIESLYELIELGKIYGFDISRDRKSVV